MSMTRVNARIYVARVLGGAANGAVIDMADEAIENTYTDWQNSKFWTFLLRDTSSTTAVSATATKSSAVVAAPSTGAFDFVNIGQTVTYSGALGTLAASTTVLSYTRGTDGVITSITLSNALGGGSYTTETGTFTFSADIPLVSGTSDYNLPLDFSGYYTARLIDSTGPKEWLKYIEQRHWDKITSDQSLTGVPEGYTTYNPISEGTQNFGTSRMRVFKTPDSSNYLVRVRYFRMFNTSSAYIDVPNQYLYQFLNYARTVLLATKRAQDDPTAYSQQVMTAFGTVQQTDEQPNDDDDGDSRLKSPYEAGDSRGPIVGNGNFDPYPL
jgi:hypothetical protein